MRTIKNEILNLIDCFDVNPIPTKLTWTWDIDNDEFGSCGLKLSNVELYSLAEKIDLSTYDDEENGFYLELELTELIYENASDTHKFNELVL